MKPIVIALAGIVVALRLTAGGCGFLPDTDQPGLVRLNLTDCPGSYESVTITVSEVSVHQDGTPDDQWESFPLDNHVFDLMSLQNGQTAVMGEEKLDPGTYSRIRLKIEAASIRLAGRVLDLDIPSRTRSGFVVDMAGLKVEPGLTYDLVMDFDSARSIVKSSADRGAAAYRLDPVIRPTLQASTGAVRGLVSDGSHLPKAYALAGGDTVSSTLVDTVTWEFLLGYLPAGRYTVVLEDTTGCKARIEEVAVVVGRIVDIGEIDLPR